MKRLALSILSSVIAAMFTSPAAQASGWIVIDPIVAAPPVVGPGTGATTTGVTGIRRTPGVPRPTPVLLQGHVSFGLHLQSEDVKVEIKDQVAKTFITQTFSNDTDRNLAGTYLFPLPDDTTFSSFSLHIDGKPVEGKILEANAARQQYEEIVRKMVDPGLLEYADYKTVRARIFPIPAHGTKTVQLEYTQLLKAENGLLKYRFPLKTKIEDSPADEIKVAVKLASPQGLRTIWSPTHTIKTTRVDDHSARISMTENDVLPDKDFFLYYSLSNNDMAANLITHKAEGEDGYFLLSLTPPFKSKAVIGKDIVLVADTSGSMSGEKLEESKKALKFVVNALGASDRFGIVEFNTDADSFKSNLVQATADNKKAACQYIEELTARGGTNMADAIAIGKTLLSGESTRPGYLIFMTDGEPTVGERDTGKLIALANGKRDIRVFDFGIGYDINTRLLNKLAEAHHGTAQYIEPEESLETAISGFFEKIRTPVLSDVKLSYKGIDVKNVYPREVKDIFAGSQVLLLGRYKKGGPATISLSGTVNGAERSYMFPVNFSQSQAGNTQLARLWAMRRIGYLTEVAQANGENREVIDEIVALSKMHGIISQYTSYLVTDPSENRRLPNGFVPPSPPMQLEAKPGRLASRKGRQTGLVPPAPAAAPVFAMSPRSAAVNGRNRLVDSAGEAGSVTQSAGAGGGGGRFRAAGFYNSAMRMQIVDELPIVHDLREAPATGKDAVLLAKAANKMKAETVLSDIEKKGVLQTVADKTFVRRANGWVDTSLSEKAAAKATVIVFGSDQYFALLKKEPDIAKYLSVGKEVILSFKGIVYKVVQPGSASG